jgi:hypothetical protein
MSNALTADEIIHKRPVLPLAFEQSDLWMDRADSGSNSTRPAAMVIIWRSPIGPVAANSFGYVSPLLYF